MTPLSKTIPPFDDKDSNCERTTQTARGQLKVRRELAPEEDRFTRRVSPLDDPG